MSLPLFAFLDGRVLARTAWLSIGSTVAILVAAAIVLPRDTQPDGDAPATPESPGAMCERSPSAHPGTAPFHTQERTGPKVLADDPNGPVIVETDAGPVSIRRVRHASSAGDPPYPACLVCHGEIENATANMAGGFELDCTFCHGGDPNATTKEEAHVHPNGLVEYGAAVPPIDEDLEYQRFVNPSNLRTVDTACGICHPSYVDRVRKSMMATAAGHYAGGLYQNGAVDTKTPIYGTFAVSDVDGTVPESEGAVESLEDLLIFDPNADPSLFATHFAAVPSQACARCHLWSRGKGFRGAEGQDGVYRADGCAACHMPYANDGLSQSADPSIDHGEPGHPMHHVVTRQIPSEQCIHCHHRGARIGLSFTGRAQMPPRLPSGPGVPGTTDELFNTNYHYSVGDTNPGDVHHEAGMHCIDCHVADEVMGDGNIWGHMDQATKIECRTCHGLPGEPPTLLDNDGNHLPNVVWTGPWPEGPVVLTSKVTGAEHVVPLAQDMVEANPQAACAMDDNHLKAQGGLECYACHSSWVPNCFGCHFERDEREMGLNFMTGEMEVGKVTTNNKIFESLRHFSIGPNAEGRVAPYLVACQPIADVTGPDGEKILDFVMPVTTNGLSGLAHNPVNPHTVRGAGEVRTCAECHRSPPTLGFGSGHYTISRGFAYAVGRAGVGRFDIGEEPGAALPSGGLSLAEGARGLAVLPNVVEGTVDFLYVARGPAGLAIYDRRPGASQAPVAEVTNVDAIDVSRAARYVYVVDRGRGIMIYDNEDPAQLVPVARVSVPSAMRVVPWGIHLLVAARSAGLVVVDVADHASPFVAGSLPGIHAVDIEPYAHHQAGPDFAVRAYVADPGFGVHIVDLVDLEAPELVGGLPLPGSIGLDAYTRWVLATEEQPSREHDYLYVAAGLSGLHVFDMTDPSSVTPVAAVTDLGGFAADVDVASWLAPPGVDDYALVANAQRGIQVLGVNDPHAPVTLSDHSPTPGVSRVVIEVQRMDRYLDEQGNELKENSHPFVEPFTREDIVRILSAPIDCGD